MSMGSFRPDRSNNFLDIAPSSVPKRKTILLEPLRWNRGTFRWSKVYWNVEGDRELEATAVNWTTILQTIIGAGIGSAVIQGVLPILRERWEKSSRAAYMAIRLAVILEAYSAACASLIDANENAQHRHDERLPDWKTRLPELSGFPDDSEGWRALDRQLAGRCLSFRNKVTESQGLITSIIFFNDDAIGDTVEAEATARGLEAWRLATALRRSHKVEAAELVWDHIEHLERIERRLEEADKQRRQG